MAPSEWYTIVLAAGASSRWGGRPKALLPVGSESALERVVRLASGAGSSRIAVVVGRHARELTPIVPPAAEVLANPDWERGRTGSVQVGLRWALGAAGVLLWPVDHPFVSAETPRRLLDTARKESVALWFVPTLAGAGGHPVAIRREAFGRILEMSPATPLRAVLPHLGVQVARLPVRDSGVTASSDTPAEYRESLIAWELQGASG